MTIVKHWPTQALSDELWLRGRRLALSALAQVELAPPKGGRLTYFETQQRCGCAVLADLERRIGSRWRSDLVSDGILGPASRRFRLRLPFILAFGHEYATSLETLLGSPLGDSSDVPDSCALLNLGLVLCDMLGDDPLGMQQLTQVIDADRLRRLTAGDRASPPAVEGQERFATPGMRVLAGTVDAFFSSVHELPRCESGAARLERLDLLVRKAYRAQLASTNYRSHEQDWRQKSVTPFVIPAAICLLTSNVPQEGVFLEIAEHIGEVFSRVDDMADIVADFYAGGANLVLARSGIPVRAPPDGEDDGLAQVLDGGALEAISGELVCHLERTIALFQQIEDGWRNSSRLREWLGMYVLDWLGQPSGRDSARV